MGIKGYKASQDNTITNGFKLISSTRGTGSNMGAADILEVYSIYGQNTTSSAELSRVLIQFPTTGISSDRAAGTIPASGSVNFFLRMFNARHSEQLPKDFTVNVLAVSQSWQEGQGLDLDGYSYETKDSVDGSNWMNGTSNFATATTNLVLQGGANLAAMDAQTFVLTDADGTSQTFTFDFDGSVDSAGTIGFTGDSNTTEAIDSIKTAINNVTALGITAGTATPAGDTDSEMTLPLTQNKTGYSGDTVVDVSGVSHLTAQNFSAGAGKWVAVGGDYYTDTYVPNSTMPKYSFTFNNGDEDLLVDVTSAVEEWISGTQTNNGFGIFLTSSQEAYVENASAADSEDGTGASVLLNTSGQKKSFYTKRFFSRSSEFFFKKPSLEARWDSRTMDDRGNFYYSSSLAPAKDNLNTIYLYNYVRGSLRNIPDVDTGTILVSIYSGSSDNTAPSGSKLALSAGGDVVAAADLNVTGGYVSTGVYSASFSFTGSTSLKTIYDVWHSASIEYVTSSINPNSLSSPGWNRYPQFTTKITNLKPLYSEDETARFRVFVRERKVTPTIYSVASSEAQGTIVPSASFEIFRTVDNETVINNSTGSATKHTFLSYDNSGSYFDLNMSLLEPGYMYGIRLMLYSSNGWREQEETFNFRVENS